MSLVSGLTEAWEDSSSSFSNLSHLACIAIAAVENPSNRLECALAYQNAILELPKYKRECDEDGFWARLNAQTAIERITADINLESKWRFTGRWWKSMQDELEHYYAKGASRPMRLVGGAADSDTMKTAIAKADAENRIRKTALEKRHYANRLRGCLNAMYRPIFEYALREDWHKIPIERRDGLMHQIHEVVGRYPDWYLDEKKKGAK